MEQKNSNVETKQKINPEYYDNIFGFGQNDWKLGNIIYLYSTDEYDDHPIILVVGKDNIPYTVRKGDTTAHIPIEITKHLIQVSKSYSPLVKRGLISSIDIPHDDEYVIEKYGKALPENTFCRYCVDYSGKRDEIYFFGKDYPYPLNVEFGNNANVVDQVVELIKGKK